MPDIYGSAAATALCCLILVLIGSLLVLFVVRRRPPRPPVPAGQPPDQADPWAPVPTADLNQQANRRLVQTDNTLTTSEQELGFAIAHYGADAATAYRAGWAAAHQELAAAFQLRQQLDDAYPADEPVQRRMLIEIIDRCARADQRRSADAEGLARLRSVESHVERLSAELAVCRDAVAARIPAVAARLTDLESRYAVSAFIAVGDNVKQAKSRITSACDELEKAAQAVAGGDRSSAASAVRGAEQALAQAGVLLDAITRLDTDLKTATVRVRTLVADVQGQVAVGKAAAADQAKLAGAVARAERVAIDVRSELAGTHPDPIGALARIEAAGSELDQALGRTHHAPELLDQAVFSARTAVDSATQFIITHRDAIGVVARTRLMEAQRHLDEAAGQTEPTAALPAAQRAIGLAEQALDAARADLEQPRTPL